VTGARPQAKDIDWKYLGGAKLDVDVYCFYEAHNVVQKPEGHLQVWTKCLPQKDLSDQQLGKDLINLGAKQLLSGYDPPYSAVEELSEKQVSNHYQRIRSNLFIHRATRSNIIRAGLSRTNVA
jgi:hypothetical protein